jgi:hypothetical protein
LAAPHATTTSRAATATAASTAASHPAATATAASTATAPSAGTGAAFSARTALGATARVDWSDARDDIGLLPRLRDFHQNENRDQHHHYDHNDCNCRTNLLPHAPSPPFAPQQPLATRCGPARRSAANLAALSYHEHARICDFPPRKSGCSRPFFGHMAGMRAIGA